MNGTLATTRNFSGGTGEIRPMWNCSKSVTPTASIRVIGILRERWLLTERKCRSVCLTWFGHRFALFPARTSAFWLSTTTLALFTVSMFRFLCRRNRAVPRRSKSFGELSIRQQLRKRITIPRSLLLILERRLGQAGVFATIVPAGKVL